MKPSVVSISLFGWCQLYFIVLPGQLGYIDCKYHVWVSNMAYHLYFAIHSLFIISNVFRVPILLAAMTKSFYLLMYAILALYLLISGDGRSCGMGIFGIRNFCLVLFFLKPSLLDWLVSVFLTVLSFLPPTISKQKAFRELYTQFVSLQNVFL